MSRPKLRPPPRPPPRWRRAWTRLPVPRRRRWACRSCRPPSATSRSAGPRWPSTRSSRPRRTGCGWFAGPPSGSEHPARGQPSRPPQSRPPPWSGCSWRAKERRPCWACRPERSMRASAFPFPTTG
ncbi:hypothetical protein D3867_34340 (plasmid) [Azospirillum argentinense]|uniref:Uncharacterized protein n=1 Tax=Azospirillum brasilense TaxID=192 RepID=A0A4D8QDF6_AZOBR|nr:hypothetical protein D3867_34340 [Azospirillum argentinense]